MTCGIYRIRNTVNGKVYIGSSQCIEKRWQQHRTDIKGKRHGNKHLQDAWRKYGAEAFVFEVVEEVAVELLIEREQAALDAVPVELRYNKGPCADCPTRGVTFSADIRARNAAIKRTPAARSHAATDTLRQWAGPTIRAARTAAIQAAAEKEELRVARRIAHQKMWADPVKKADVSARIKSAVNTPKIRAQRSAAAKARWANPGFRERVCLAIKKGMATSDVVASAAYKQHCGDGGRAVWAKAENRERFTQAAKERMSDPAHVARMNAAATTAQRTPEARAKKAAAMKEIWAKRKAGALPNRITPATQHRKTSGR
jgi:group I intron endonuclease